MEITPNVFDQQKLRLQHLINYYERLYLMYVGRDNRRLAGKWRDKMVSAKEMLNQL